MDETPRLRACWDLMQASVREGVGLHRYDGRIQDLSDAGVAAGLARLADPADPGPTDPHDRAHLQVVEEALRWTFATAREHHRNPLVHLDALDLSCYDREYAPEPERAAAAWAQLAAWPDAVDVAVATLDAVPAPVATALLPAARGLGDGLPQPSTPGQEAVREAALAAQARLVAHLDHLAATGDPDCAVGEAGLARELGVWEGLQLDVEELATRADAERDRLWELLREACRQLDAHAGPVAVVERLRADHPDAEGVLEEARAVTEEVLAFTAEHDLVPWTDGTCLVGPAPASRRWAMAMMAWAGPEEPDAPSWYYVTPPEPDWPAEEVEEWLGVFSRTTLPAITVHEVSPGHYAHGRALRHAPGAVRRTLVGATFAEGWAHYTEEMVIEAGFRDGDPRYTIGMCLEALVRTARLRCSVGLHRGEMTVEDATARFEADALLGTAAARSEARRGTFDVGYGRYTLGKLALLDLREQARAAWGAGFSLPRFHRAVLDLGGPPLGLLGTAVERG
ncbi:MAG: DUF885 family protein [Kineosporiaceae bacterium]